MNKTKNISKISLAIFALMFVVLTIAIMGIFSHNMPTAYAEETQKYTLIGSVNYVGLLPYGAGYNKTETYSTTSNIGKAFNVQLYGTSVHGTGTATNNKVFGFSYITIVANVNQSTSPHNSNYPFAHQSFSLKNNTTGATVASSSLSGTGYKKLVGKTLSDGHYTLTYVAGGTRSGIGAGKITDTFTYSFYVDSTPPSYTLKANGSNIASESYTNKQVVYSASDTRFSKLYYKRPGATSYASTTSRSYTISNTSSNNGMWYFMASDTVGNYTSTVSVYMDTEKPAGTLKANGSTVSSGSYTNKSFNYTATDNSGTKYMQYKTPTNSSWQSYSGSIISTSATNGWYTFRSYDKTGNYSDERKIYLDSGKPSGAVYKENTIVTSGSKVKGDYIKFIGNDSQSGVQTVYVKEPKATSYKVGVNSSQYAVEGTYHFYCIDKTGNSSPIYTITLDNSPPNISISGANFNSTTSSNFTVSTDNGTIYYKYENESYKSSGSEFEVTSSTKDGKYYFYAQDSYGDVSETKSVTVAKQAPTGYPSYHSPTNRYKFVWDNPNWTATLNGKAYTNGAWIEEEGSHKIVLSNNAGQTSEVNFSIGHKYVVASVVNPTCTAKGYTNYSCISCSHTKKDSYTNALGHDYKSVGTVQPTCSEKGYTNYKCSRCSAIKVDNYVDKKAHNYLETGIPATCTESGKLIYTCSDCNHEYYTETEPATGHSFSTTVIKNATCSEKGIRHQCCDKCGHEQESETPMLEHTYVVTDNELDDGNINRCYDCTVCGHHKEENLGNQYENVTNYVDYLFEQYSPYMWWVLLATTGVWSIAMGIAIIIAHKNEDKEKAKKMLVNHLIGLVAIAVIVIACPYLVKGIASLVT